MKHTILLLTTALLLVSAANAQAPELKNMLPNSYQKLARLSEREERDFMENAAVTKAISAIDDYHLKQKPLSELHRQVFAETDCGLQFYRLLVSANPLEAAYTAEYKSKTVTADECLRMQRGTVFQIVFLKTKSNALRNIGVFPYAHHWASQGKDEGFTFNDLMIKPLNKDEIGFFVTEVSVGFVVDRRKWDENTVKIDYYLCKNQIAAYNRTWFSKYRIAEEERITGKSKDSVDIQASFCLFDSKCPFKYSIQKAFDGNPATSYVENTEDDLMKISFPGYGKEYSDNFTVSIINGYSLNENLYTKNNRVKEISVVGYELNDIKTELIERIPKILKFEDKKLSFQVLSFDFTCFGPFYFKVSGIYSGNTYNDTCIAELNLRDDSADEWFFGDIHD